MGSGGTQGTAADPPALSDDVSAATQAEGAREFCSLTEWQEENIER